MESIGVIAMLVAFVTGCVTSAKFWIGVIVGSSVPAVRSMVARMWAWARRKVGA